MPTSPRLARRAALARAAVTAAACVVAVGLTVVTAAPAAAAGAGAQDRRCAKHLRDATKVTRYVVVFAVEDTLNGGSTVYACRRAGGPPLRIGYDAYSDPEYGSDSVVYTPQVVGRWVATWIETGGGGTSSESSKYDPTASTPSAVRNRVRLIDTRSGRIADLRGATAPTVAANGALAWTDRGVLKAAVPRPRGRRSFTLTPRVLDRGTDITALRFSGTDLHWLRDGTARSAALTR